MILLRTISSCLMLHIRITTGTDLPDSEDKRRIVHMFVTSVDKAAAAVPAEAIFKGLASVPVSSTDT